MRNPPSDEQAIGYLVVAGILLILLYHFWPYIIAGLAIYGAMSLWVQHSRRPK